MKAVFAFLGQRWFLGLVGLILLSLLIWFIGPYLAIGVFRPFAGVLARAVTIAVLFLAWGLLAWLRVRRARQASQRLGAAIVGESAGDGQGEQLRERFEEAVGYLRQSKQTRNLYQLPWYVIVGPPGSGKTTALTHSGLNFPLDQRYGRDALRGVGGTRNCDWWFTDEAVLLDTAGRYFSQDTDAGSDAAEWRRFLDLLCRYRKRRPINGVMVTLSAADLLTGAREGRERHVAMVKRRIDELQRHLKVQVPVYFLVTKCDLIAGFVEFFDDLDHDGRAQVWGMTLAQPKAGGASSEWFTGEYQRLLERLDARLLTRLDQEREPQRRARLFGFPRQMAGLREALAGFIRDTFEGSGYDRPVMLRGVYFTSGTQEGTPIDRMMESLSRAYGLGAAGDAAAPPAGQGRAYFIHRLLRDVVFAESGLAGVNWRFEVGRAVAQNVAYLALLALLGVLVAGWAASYRYNADYLADVEATLDAHGERATPTIPARADVTEVLPRLDAPSEVAAEADRHNADTPLLMGLGLYRGEAVGQSAVDAYHQGVRELLVPRVAALLEQRLRDPGTPATAVYAYLKGYLMLAIPERLDREQLGIVVREALARALPEQPTLAKALALHFNDYVDTAPSLPAVAADAQLVAQARASLAQASVPVLMLSRLEPIYGPQHAVALRLDREAGLGSDGVFRRKSGTPLSEPIPALYTRTGFEEITGGVGGELVSRFLEDRWVFGPDLLPSGPTARLKLAEEFVHHYEGRYIDHWDEVLADIELAPLLDVDQATQALAALTGPASPLRGLMSAIDEQTHFPEPEAEVTAAAGGRLDGLFGMAGEARERLSGPRPGARIGGHFGELHRLVAGADGSSPMDQLIASLDALYAELSSLGDGLGDNDAMAVLGSPGGAAQRRLQADAARQPEPFGDWLTELAGSGERVALRSLRGDLAQRYRNEVQSVCNQLASERYPFDANSERPIPLSDFARLFGPGGVMDTFFTEHLAELVDTSGAAWRWRGGKAADLGISGSVLEQFRRARLIRDIFFKDGGDTPRLSFRLTPRYLDGRARQVSVSLGEQSLNYRHGPPIAERFEWPDANGDETIVLFEDRRSQRPNFSAKGPWSWFRVLTAAGAGPESDTAYLATFEAGGYSARVLIEFESSLNPLNYPGWRRFRCPAGL